MADTDDRLAILNGGFSQLLDSGRFSDLQITCSDGTVYNVHKAILCGQNSFFMNALNPDSNFKEAQTNQISLEHDEPFAVKALIEYLYRSEYTDIDAAVKELLLFHIHIYAIGETYDVHGLKNLACDRVKAIVAKESLEELDLPVTIKAIYTTTVSSDRGLRDKVIALVRTDIKKFMGLEGFFDMLEDVAQFSGDLARSLLTDPLCTTPRYKCLNCCKEIHITIPDGASTLFCPVCGWARSTKSWKEQRASLPTYECRTCGKVTEMELVVRDPGDPMRTFCPWCRALHENWFWEEFEVEDNEKF